MRKIELTKGYHAIFMLLAFLTILALKSCIETDATQSHELAMKKLELHCAEAPVVTPPITK